MSDFLRPFRAFRQLSALERWELAKAAVLLPTFWACLRTLGVERSLRLVEARRRDVPCIANSSDALRLARVIGMAARYSPAPTTCLTRSLLLVWWLNAKGISARLRMGVRLEGGSLRAHAWVEQAGAPINDEPDIARRFAAFEGILPSDRFS